MKQGYFYIANKTHNGKQIGLIFVLNIGNGKLLKLSSLKYIYKDNSILVVFTPVSRNEAVVLKERFKKSIGCLFPFPFPDNKALDRE